MTLPRELLQRLPKTDLHCHLDGSLRIETLIELARRHAVELPTFDREALRELVVAGDQVGSLDDYLRAFDITLGVLQEPAALERCAYELAEDAWRENVRYLEVRYSPLLHARRGLGLDHAIEAVLRGLAAAERDFGIRTGVILCAIRALAPSSSMALAELGIAFKRRGVVSLTGRRFSKRATTTSTARCTPVRRAARARCTRRSTSSARIASATAPG